jgi:hypothetical protein
MSTKISARKVGVHYIASSGPDVCKTPMGSSMVPVAYHSIAFLDDSVRVATTVFNNGDPDFNINSRAPVSIGNDPGVGRGVVQTGYKGPGAVIQPSKTVFSEGWRTARHGDLCVINMADLGAVEDQRTANRQSL